MCDGGGGVCVCVSVCKIFSIVMTKRYNQGNGQKKNVSFGTRGCRGLESITIMVDMAAGKQTGHDTRAGDENVHLSP